MSNYVLGVNLPGPKKAFTSEAAPVVGSSTIVPAFPIVLDADNMQQTIDGYIDCEVNTNTSQLIIQHTAALGTNELLNNYAYVSFPTPEVRLIVSNTSADADASSTLTVDRPFSTAPTDGHTVNIRLWEDFNIPRLFSSLNGFTEAYIDKDSSGNYEWTNAQNAYYTISEFKNKGGALFYAIAVQDSTVANDLVVRLGTGLTGNATFKARMLTTIADCVCMAKQPVLTIAASLSGANWATIDGAWSNYVNSRATDDTADDTLRDMFYVTDTPSASATAAATYRDTTLNSTNPRLVIDHGQYLVSSLTAGQNQAVSCAPARCATINRVSTTAPESYGHAFSGKNYTNIAIGGLVERDLSPANRNTLIKNGINPLITKPGQGAWFETELTQKFNASSTGSEPLEHLHVVIGRSKIWNMLQPILDSVISENNNDIVLQGLVSRIDSVMDTLKSQDVIFDYEVVDVTSASDLAALTARIELKVWFNSQIAFVELKLNAVIGG